MYYQADVADVVYRYDGSMQGFLCCVFESFRRRELPAAINSPQEERLSLFPDREIVTDPVRARRVLKGIERLGGGVRQRFMTAFLSTDPEKEQILLRYLRVAFSTGRGVDQMLGHPDVSAAWQLERAVSGEAHHFIEFLRFEERGGMLGAVIHPKNMVLPLLRPHFCSRLPDEDFLIYDAAHGVAMLRRGRDVHYLEMADYDPVCSPEEEQWQNMWKRFFKALTIEQRRNERCQQTHCPRRFWQDMCEMPGGCFASEANTSARTAKPAGDRLSGGKENVGQSFSDLVTISQTGRPKTGIL